MSITIANPLLLAVVVLLVAYVPVAWRGASRYGTWFPWAAAVAAAAMVALVAALTRGVASAHSVGRRRARRPERLAAWDWIIATLAGVMGLCFIATVVIVVGALVWR